MGKINLIEPRKIQHINFSYLISLPSAWIKARGLKKGDGLDVDSDDKGRLILTPVDRGTESET